MKRLELVEQPRKAALEHVLERLREISSYAEEHDLGSIYTFIQASITEVEFKLTGKLPLWRSKSYPRRRR